MSDAFFERLFGDSEPGDFGTGWISGTASVFFGVLGLGGALCLHFPALLSLGKAAEARASAASAEITAAAAKVAADRT